MKLTEHQEELFSNILTNNEFYFTNQRHMGETLVLQIYASYMSRFEGKKICVITPSYQFGNFFLQDIRDRSYKEMVPGRDEKLRIQYQYNGQILVRISNPLRADAFCGYAFDIGIIIDCENYDEIVKMLKPCLYTNGKIIVRKKPT